VSAPKGAFARELDALEVAALSRRAASASPADVEAALARLGADAAGGPSGPARSARPAAGRAAGRGGLDDVAALLSPAALDRLEEIATAARAVTLRRFGRTVRLFAPLYVSNACLSSCTYCGFAKGLEVVRRTLTPAEVEAEARLLAGRGFRHLLLVSGEHRVEVSADYLLEVVGRLRPIFPSLSIETQTWSDDTYARLVAAGLEGVIHYQETYDRARYAEVHVAGWKRDFDRRLSSVERAAAAGARRLGLGALLGLAPDWRADVLALAAHADFSARRFWGTEISVALPRIKPSASGFPPTVEVSDAEFVLAHCALRLFAPDVGISLSTREPAALRDGLARIAVTTMSAGSSTEPGGYSAPGRAQEQWAVSDERPPAEIAAMLDAAGYEPVWKDAFPLVDV
jgi:2-iminoacetate synthase